MSEVEQLIGVPIIVLDESRKRFLAGIRRGGYKAGTLGVPGGRIQFGETLKEACMREFKEEVGLESDNFEFVGVVRENQETHIFIHFIFVCRVYSGKIQNLEPEKCEGWDWYSFENLPDNILNGHKAGIEMYLSGEKLRNLV